MGKMGCRQTVPALISVFSGLIFWAIPELIPKLPILETPGSMYLKTTSYAFEDPWSKTRWFMHLKPLIRVQVVTYFGARASRGVCVTFNIKSVL